MSRWDTHAINYVSRPRAARWQRPERLCELAERRVPDAALDNHKANFDLKLGYSHGLFLKSYAAVRIEDRGESISGQTHWRIAAIKLEAVYANG
jgi:hypothetical protein